MSASFLSHVENGKGDITFMRLRRLVALYGMQLVDLVAAPHPADERVVRASEREDINNDHEDISIYLLAPDSKRSMMPILCVWNRGANLGRAATGRERGVPARRSRSASDHV